MAGVIIEQGRSAVIIAAAVREIYNGDIYDNNYLEKRRLLAEQHDIAVSEEAGAAKSFSEKR